MSKLEAVAGCSRCIVPLSLHVRDLGCSFPPPPRSLPPTEAAGDPRAPKGGQAAKPRSFPFLPVRHLCCCHQMRNGK